LLPDILSGRGPLLAAHARDGERVLPGRIYVAPPDYHMVLEPGVVRLVRGPRENRHRPAIDPPVPSAPRASGPRGAAPTPAAARRPPSWRGGCGRGRPA